MGGQRQPMRYFTFPDLRPYLDPPVPATTLGSFPLPNNRTHQFRLYGNYTIGDLNLGLGANFGFMGGLRFHRRHLCV